MRKLFAFAAAALALGVVSGARADEVKIGVVLHYSGPFAALGDRIQKGIDLWMQLHGDAVAGNKITLIKRDAAGSVDTSKRLTQELITRDHVQFLAGYILTPEGLAVAPDVTEAKVPTVILNAATAVITTKSPYLARVSLTLPQTTEIMGTWAATKGGVKQAYTAVSDYGPGLDADAAFKLAFTKAGGTVVDTLKFPLMNPDFAPFLQRIKDSKPQAVYTFIPGGSQPIAFAKTWHDLGLDKAKIKLLPSEEYGDDADLGKLPDTAVGTIMSMHYSSFLKTKTNEDFVAAWHKAYGADSQPDFFAVQGYDGMALIYDVVAKLNGKIDGDAAMAAIKGWKHDSPRGPIMIDPETRDIVQNIYIGKIVKVGGKLETRVIQTYPMVKDPWKEEHKGG